MQPSARRGEVSFYAACGELSTSAALAGLVAEGIDTEAPLADLYQPTEGTELMAAHHLTPRRIAVVLFGTRPDPCGVKTFCSWNG